MADAEIAFGTYLPTGQSGVPDLVVRGVAGGVQSLETGVQVHIDGSFPIEDAAVEVQRIEAGRPVASSPPPAA